MVVLRMTGYAMACQGDPRKWAYKAVPTSPTSPGAPATIEAQAGDAPVRIPLLGARQDPPA